MFGLSAADTAEAAAAGVAAGAESSDARARRELHNAVRAPIFYVREQLYGDGAYRRDALTGWWWSYLLSRLMSIQTQVPTGDVAVLTRRLARVRALMAYGNTPAYVGLGVVTLGVLGGVGYGGYRIVKKMRKKR